VPGANGVAVTIPPLPPGTPSGITVPASNTTGAYTVSWGAASGVVTRYELEESTSSSFTTATLKYSGTALSYAVSGKASGTYYYRVRACNDSGCSSYVAGANGVVVTLPTAPGVPASITVPSRVNPATAFTVSWGASSGTVSYYELQDGYTTSLFPPILPTTWGTIYTGLNRSLPIAGKAAGTKVAYRVRACNSVGCSGYRTSTIVNINKLFGANDPVWVGLNEWAE
jgi:hypothetical protein